MLTKRGWLVNDCLTCIPNTKTFWHHLLEWIPNLTDKTGGHTNFPVLASRIERAAKSEGSPNYIIRNATYFRKINLPCKQIALLQDCFYSPGRRAPQKEVCNNATVTVFNSNFTYEKYKNDITGCETKVIPLGTDFDLFNKSDIKHNDVLPNSILYVGSSVDKLVSNDSKVVRGKRFGTILNLIKNTNYNFCLVMKDGFTMNHPRVKVFNRVSHDVLVKIYNSCEMLVSASPTETQHMASIEAGACGLPLVMVNSGALYNVPSGAWGLKVDNGNFVECIEYVKTHKDEFSPREFLLKMGLSKESCKKEWINFIEQIN